MRKSFIAAAILAAVSSFAVAQTTSPTTNGGMVNEGAAATSGSTGTMDATNGKMAKQTGKSMKHSSKKSNMATGSSGMAGSTGTTGATGTTAAGTPDQTTSGATKPAGDASMKH